MIQNHYNVVIVGGGVSGTALFYELGHYTDIKSIAIVEKYSKLASLNSNATSNSQTIHCGDIETNYTLEKAKKVKKTAQMVINYCLQNGHENDFLLSHRKMAIGVGDEEVEYIKKRFDDFKDYYPDLEIYDREKLKEIEPNLIFDQNGDERKENVLAMGTDGQYTTIDFSKLAESFASRTIKIQDKITDIFLNSEILNIQKIGDTFFLQTAQGTKFTADFVVVNAGAHSLFLAHKMGYGLNYGNLSIAGSFFMSTKKILNSKVYTVQHPKLPFAALHGDADILANGFTRFGPTAFAIPKLERYHGNKSIIEFFKTLKFDKDIYAIFKDLFSDITIRNYILRNLVFEIPYFSKKLFVKEARKIVPSLQYDDIKYAKGFGGVRPQVLDKEQKKLLLGEVSINSENGIIFNMTPSPGATSCLGNALKDTKKICEFLGNKFDEEKINKELLK